MSKEFENSLNPKMVRLISIKRLVHACSSKAIPRRYITEYYDEDGNFRGVFDPEMCLTCFHQEDGAMVQGCRSDHK